MKWLDPSARFGLLLLAGIAAHALWSLLDGLAMGADGIDVNTGSAGALPAAVAIGCWAAVLLLRHLTNRAERRIMRLASRSGRCMSG